jgi:hypothetical protein
MSPPANATPAGPGKTASLDARACEYPLRSGAGKCRLEEHNLSLLERQRPRWLDSRKPYSPARTRPTGDRHDHPPEEQLEDLLPANWINLNPAIGTTDYTEYTDFE